MHLSISAEYRSFAKHYDTVILPAGIRKLKDKIIAGSALGRDLIKDRR